MKHKPNPNYDFLFSTLKVMESKSENHSFIATQNKGDAKFKLTIGSWNHHVQTGELSFRAIPVAAYTDLRMLDLPFIEQMAKDLAKHSNDVDYKAQAAFGAIVGGLCNRVKVIENQISDKYKSALGKGKRMTYAMKGILLDENSNHLGIVQLEFSFAVARRGPASVW